MKNIPPCSDCETIMRTDCETCAEDLVAGRLLRADEYLMQYTQLVKQIEDRQGPQLAALFTVITKACVKADVFQPGAIIRITKEILEGETPT